jgi:hypothetical protein
MRGLFRRHNNDCCDTCAPTCCSAPAPTCCQTDCCESGGHGFRHRMRGLFRRHSNDGCDCGCAPPCCGNGCGGTFGAVGGVPGAAKGGEQIPPPKDGNPGDKMPNKDEKEKDKGNETPAGTRLSPGQVQINVAPTSPVPSAAPALQAAPAVVPSPAANEERPF